MDKQLALNKLIIRYFNYLDIFNLCIYSVYMKTLFNIRTDLETKKRAQRAAKALGIPLSTIINAYLKQFGYEKRIYFAVPLQPNKKTQKLLRTVHKDYQKGENISPMFTTAEEMDAYLNS